MTSSKGPLRVGIGGPVGSGKTSLTDKLCKAMRENYSVAVITKHELVLAIVGGLFVLETVSVIVQVASFKLTGKRVFQMAPLHHHFEKKGWAEPTIVIRFWIIAMILALVGLATLKLR